MSTPDIVRATLPVIAVLDELGVPYFVGGSVASSLFGVARATADVDVIADLRRAHVKPFAAALLHDYYVDAEVVDDAVRRRTCFHVILESFARRREDSLDPLDPGHGRAWVASPEDVVLHKLQWYRLGGGTVARRHDRRRGSPRAGSRRGVTYTSMRWRIHCPSRFAPYPS